MSKSKHVQTVMIADPENGKIVGIDILKDEKGVFSGVESDFSPHYVQINYGDDGVTAGVYHFANKKLAIKMVFGILLNRLNGIFDEDDDGVEFSHKIATALKAGETDEALKLYHSIPDNLEVIEYNRVNFGTSIPEHYDYPVDDLNDYIQD